MSFSRFDHAMMRRALDRAAKGLYTTTPNPRVGCVVARGDDVIGEGWHEKAGGPHAEVRALENIDAWSRHGVPAPARDVHALVGRRYITRRDGQDLLREAAQTDIRTLGQD